MRTSAAVAVLLCGVSGYVCAQERVVERTAIDSVKRMLVSSLDSALPHISLEYYLTSEAERGRVDWEVNDCGEQTGDPKADGGRDMPMCVSADMHVYDNRAITVMLNVGTFGKGLVGEPKLMEVIATSNDGQVRAIKLREIPMEAHRGEWTPRPQPRLIAPGTSR